MTKNKLISDLLENEGWSQKIKFVAKKSVNSNIRGMSVEDVEQEMKLAFIRAVRTYKENVKGYHGRKQTLDSYIWKCMKNYLGNLSKKTRTKKRDAVVMSFDIGKQTNMTKDNLQDKLTFESILEDEKSRIINESIDMKLDIEKVIDKVGENLDSSCSNICKLLYDGFTIKDIEKRIKLRKSQIRYIIKTYLRPVFYRFLHKDYQIGYNIN